MVSDIRYFDGKEYKLISTSYSKPNMEHLRLAWKRSGYLYRIVKGVDVGGTCYCLYIRKRGL